MYQSISSLLEESQRKARALNRDKDTSTASVMHVVRHEVAHCYHRAAPDLSAEELEKFAEIVPGVSGSATKGPLEFLAEFVVAGTEDIIYDMIINEFAEKIRRYEEEAANNVS